MTIQLKYTSDFPSKQAEEIQKHLKELDKQGKLKEEFMSRYGDNLGKPNSLANYILKNWEKDGKKLYLEYTGIEIYKENKNLIKAIGVKLSEVTKGSGRYFLWKCCTCQYEWVQKLNGRTSNRKHDCPECAKIKRGEASHSRGETLEHWCNTQGEYGQQLKEEFIGRLEDGTPVTLGELSKGSHDKVWWHCSKCEHEWPAAVCRRTNENFKIGCPACGRKICIPGVNDLETYCHQHPKLNYILEEFTGLDENNQPIKPSEVARASTKKVWFGCNKCHKRWLAAVYCRTYKKSGCPHCAVGNQTSFPEQFIYHSLLQLFPNIKNRQKDKLKNYEYDIVIPELNLCIEYSGYNWHADKLDRDQAKADHCKANKIKLLQIYSHHGEITNEQGLQIQDTYTPSQIIYKVNNDKTLHIIQLQQIIKFILQEYAPNHSIEEIDFTISESEANKVMGKA